MTRLATRFGGESGIDSPTFWKKKPVVPLAGLEPARCFHHLILSQARLPIPPQGHFCGASGADNSGGTVTVNGAALPYGTLPPPAGAH